MATTGVINGRDLGLWIGGSLIALAKTAKITTSHEFRDTTTKDDDWNTRAEGNRSWKATCDGLVSFDAAYGTDELAALVTNRTEVTITFETGVSGDTKRSGVGRITSIEITAANNESVTYSATFEGSGECTKSEISTGPVTIDSYSEENVSGALSISPAGATIAGQTFSVGATKTLTSCTFYLARIFGSTGTLTAKIYEHTGTYGSTGVPTGSAIATSESISVPAMETGFNLVEFTFSGINQITLSASTCYCVCVEFDGTGGMEAGIDTSSPSHGGNCVFCVEGEWTAYADADVCFYVTGQ